MAPSSDGSSGAIERATATDERFMAIALEEARAAARADEVPVGACLVRDGKVVAQGRNRTRERNDPLAHAEVLVLTEAFRVLGDSRLVGATLYCTLEPCFMCAGALLHARVDRVVWGVRDPKFGGCASLGNVLTDARANHRAHLTEGVLADESRELLQTFFRSKRQKKQDDQA